jgi:hypothetical protein
VEACDEPAVALGRARAIASDKMPVVACGSMFLVGAVRAMVLGEAVDPMAVSDPAARRPTPG